MLNILITGGAGYIGSHFILEIEKLNKYNITVLDNLSTGNKKSLNKNINFIKMDLNQTKDLETLFKKKHFDIVVHFAASVKVPESIENPNKYYQNNTINSLNLINLCLKYKVNNFIFSSTAAVYGQPNNPICKENDILQPINPYGHSKLMTEQMLQDISKTDPNFKYIILRYFNVAGADPNGKIGQMNKDASHLITMACKAAKNNKDLEIFGTNYKTKDGTCERDYIHVTDLASAHISAINYLLEKKHSNIFNCGYNNRFSVKEVIESVKKISSKDFNIILSPRREGDPASLSAENTKIMKLLNWQPKYNDLDLIIKHAYNWELKNN